MSAGSSGHRLMQPARLPPGQEWSAVVVGAGGGAVVGAGAVVGPGVGAGVVVVVVGTVKMCEFVCLFKAFIK